MAAALGSEIFTSIDNLDIDSLRTLIQNGADPNIRIDGETPLFLAVTRPYLPAVRLLVNKGADKTIPVDDPETWEGLNNAQEASVHNVETMMPGSEEALAIGYLVADPQHKAVYQKKLATMSKTDTFADPANNDIKEVAADALRRESVREGIGPLVEKRERVLAKRGIVEGLSGTPLPKELKNLIGHYATGEPGKSKLSPETLAKLKELGIEPKPKSVGGRRFTRKQCKKFTCKKMGFTQKASCRPYKNCYRSTARGVHKKRRTHKR